MASILMSSMYYVLVTEVVVVLFLCLPIKPSWRMGFVSLVSDSVVGKVLRPAAKFLFVVVAAVGIDSYRTSLDLHSRLQDIKGEGGGRFVKIDDMEKRYFRAQRNMYITMFALLQLAVIRALVTSLRETSRLQALVEAQGPAPPGGQRPHAD